MANDVWTDWMAVASALAIVAAYEAWHARQARLQPPSMSRSAHALLRRQWVQALSAHAGSEILAVQALRNSLMSSTITASTAALMLMGCMTLVMSNIGTVQAFLTGAVAHGTVKLVLVLLMVATLFATYVCAAMSMRYFNHAGYVMSLPVGSESRARYQPMCLAYVSRAGVLYGWGLRCFLYIAPLMTGLIMPSLMPPVALMLVLALRLFDRPGPMETPSSPSVQTDTRTD